ncbi:MAG: pyrroline-5-carboxylate reductase [Candidatus Omnitrophica bacterium]|nr:pyrroline-5-carboxylate reductase [Candidatus Omnitrophota bacterium]
MLKNKKIGFIGAGNMATAIIGGLIGSGAVRAGDVYISEKDKRKRLKKAGLLKVGQVQDNKELLERCDIVVLSVKPQDIDAVLAEIKELPGYGKLIISIAAGITTKHIKKYLLKTSVVRAMPNIGCLKEKSVTAVCFGGGVDIKAKKAVRAIFCAVGKVEEVSEKQMDAVTALSGSGPAYIAYICKALAAAALEEGLSKKKARRLIFETVLSTVFLLSEKNMDFDKLIKMVASKGGTTEAALKVYESSKLDKILKEGIKAAVKRSKKLSK